MNPRRIAALLDEVARGDVSPADALRRISWLPVEELADGDDTAFARVDHHRALRQGFSEVVFCAGKTPAEVVAICERLAATGDGFLATRAEPDTLDALRSRFPDAQIHARGRIAHLPGDHAAEPDGPPIVVVSAGTADLAVAEEAALTVAALGHPVERLYDVGVAGLHRLLAGASVLDRAVAVIVVAGMEGALPSVVGGLVAAPVIAVPTSIGYGASFGGLAALLAMLNSCAAGIAVVNIDNGFGAACAASRIARTAARRP